MIALALACAYVLGTFPSADLAARFAVGRHAEIRKMGSGNPGAANVMGELGRGWGLFVLVLDVAKGVAACVVGHWMAGDAGASAAGSAAVIGHCFPLWNEFHGGKGVATGAGQVLMTFPVYFPVNAVVMLIAHSRGWRPRAKGATVAACAAWVAGAAVWWLADLPNLWGPEPDAALLAGAAVTCAVILYRFATAPREADVASSAT